MTTSTVERSQSNDSTAIMSAYQSRWESRSSIRSRPRKVIDFSRDGSFFPEDKQPLLLNDTVKSLGDDVRQMILLQSFYKYLHDIVHLEVHMINSACMKLIYDDLPVQYSDGIKLEAYTILIDEYYHVYNAKDMMAQLDRQFPNRHKFVYPKSDSAHAMDEIKQKLPETYRAIFEILAVCIFETTLVRELVEFFNTPDVHPSIKNYVNDHMNDESRHFKYFFDLMTETWAKLSDEARAEIGPLLGEFITLYLNVDSDKQFNLALLDSIIQNPEKSQEIVAGLYKGFAITPDIPIVKNVISVFRQTNLLDDESVQAGFKSIGWNL